MRDKKFVIDSIKMDLYRLVTAAGDLNNNISTESLLEFLNHAELDFNKIELNERENELKNELLVLKKEVHNCLENPTKRLRWTEDILTIRCRL